MMDSCFPYEGFSLYFSSTSSSSSDFPSSPNNLPETRLKKNWWKMAKNLQLGAPNGSVMAGQSMQFRLAQDTREMASRNAKW